MLMSLSIALGIDQVAFTAQQTAVRNPIVSFLAHLGYATLLPRSFT